MLVSHRHLLPFFKITFLLFASPKLTLLPRKNPEGGE